MTLHERSDCQVARADHSLGCESTYAEHGKLLFYAEVQLT